MTTLPATDDHDAPTFTAEQVLAILDVQPAFLRRLDQEDLARPGRSAAEQARYSRHDIGRIQRVTELTGAGMTLDAVRRVLTLEEEVRRLKAEMEGLKDPERTPEHRTSSPLH